MSLILHTLAVTDPGLVRTNNEDMAFAGRRLIAVADGMGGAPAGEVASEIVIRSLAPVEGSAPDQEPLAALLDAIGDANRRIRDVADAEPANEGMGTTVTAILLSGHRIALAHVGDSRGYLLRGGALRQLTRDDTFVQALVEQGGLTAAEARRHPRRSLITRAVQGGQVEPSTAALIAEPGDRLLLCSDGLSDVVEDDAISLALTTHPDRQRCAEQLVTLARQGGAPDNVTVVLADVAPDGADV